MVYVSDAAVWRVLHFAEEKCFRQNISHCVIYTLYNKTDNIYGTNVQYDFVLQFGNVIS